MVLTGIAVADFQRIAEDWRRDLRRTGKSLRTVEAYEWAFKSLIKHAEGAGIINAESLERWQDDQIARLNPRSQALAATAIRTLLNWAADRDLCDPRLARAVRSPKYSRGLPRPLAANDLLRVRAHLLGDPSRRSKPSVRELRDRALFHYIMATGGSISEILQARRSNFEHQVVRQIHGGDKALTIPPRVAGEIQAYLDARTDQVEWLWVSFTATGKVTRLTPGNARDIWKRLADQAGVPTFNSRQLRHTSATRLAERGHDLVDLALHLGARDVRSVQGYAQVAARRLQNIRADLDLD